MVPYEVGTTLDNGSGINGTIMLVSDTGNPVLYVVKLSDGRLVVWTHERVRRELDPTYEKFQEPLPVMFKSYPPKMHGGVG